MPAMSFRNAFLGFLGWAILSYIISLPLGLIPEGNQEESLPLVLTILAVLIALIVFYIWFARVILEKTTGYKMGVWSAIGYTIGVLIITLIIALLPAVLIFNALFPSSEIMDTGSLIYNIFGALAYSAIAGVMFYSQYKDKGPKAKEVEDPASDKKDSDE